MGAFSFLNKEIAIDLGTANTIIIYNDKVVVDEPSIVALQRDTKKIIAVGKRAMMMHGKTQENIKMTLFQLLPPSRKPSTQMVALELSIIGWRTSMV